MIGEIHGIRVCSDMNPEIDFIVIPCETQLIPEIQPIISGLVDAWWEDNPCVPLSTYVVEVLAEQGYNVELFTNEEEGLL